MKTHNDIAEWLDYVRGLSSPERRHAMQQHSQSCQDCERTVLILERAVHAAAADRALEVPEQVVRNARSIFSRHASAKVPLMNRLLATLTFDSLLQPALEGIRSIQQCEVRQLAYEAGCYRLDIRIENEPGVSKNILVGQISNQRQPGSYVENVPVKMTSGSKILGRTVSNTLGEFLIEFVPKQSVLLSIQLQDVGQQIELRLDGLLQNRIDAD